MGPGWGTVMTKRFAKWASAGLLQSLGRKGGAAPLSAQIVEAQTLGTALWPRDGNALQ
jgi:hypothetical protein